MSPLRFRAPTDVVFGCAVRREIPDRVRQGRWGVLSSAAVLRLPEVVEVLAACRAQGGGLVPLGTVSPNPRIGEIEAALAVAEREALDGVLAIGGGSVLDAAKVLRVALRHGGRARDVLSDLAAVVARPSVRPVQLIAVPTTAGTGAEVSQGAIITDDRERTKAAARGAALVPDAAVIDPDFTARLPVRIAAETGFDVVAHAVETYLSRAASRITDLFAERALAEVPPALLAVVAGDGTAAHRSTLAFHAWMMGYNLAHASTCLPHRVQYPIGARTDTSHQAGLAAVYPAWFRRVERVAPERARSILELVGPVTPGASRASEAVGGLLQRIGVTPRLRDFGLAESDLDSLVVGVTGRLDLDPLDPTPAVVRDILLESL